MSRNAPLVASAVERFVRASIAVREKRQPEPVELVEVFNQLLNNVARGRSDDTPFSWEEAAALMDEVAIWHLKQTDTRQSVIFAPHPKI